MYFLYYIELLMSTLRTFRLDKQLLSELEKEASRQRISVNSLVNRLIEGYVTYGRYREHFDTITLNRLTFLSFIEKLSDEDLVDIARVRGKETPRELIPLCGKKLDLEGVLFFMKTVLQDHCHWFIMYVFDDNGSLRIVLRHQWGRKWSKWLRAYIESLSLNILQVRPSFEEEADNYVIFTLRK